MPSVTLTFTAPQGNRIANSLGIWLGLTNPDGSSRPATAAEYADWLRDTTKRMVQGQEIQAAQAALAQPADLQLT